MRLYLALIGLLLINFQVVAQSEKISESELDRLHIKTIQSQHLFLINGPIYVEATSNIERIKGIDELGYLKFLTTEELIKESIKKRKTLDVIRIVQRFISSDTIDINIGYLKVTAKRRIHFNNGLRFKKADFKLSCGGTDGYKPTCRFIFNSENQKWEQLKK